MGRLERNEFVAMAGAVLLAGGLFVKWYEAVSSRATIDGTTGLGTYSGWEVHSLMRWVLLLTAIAPFVLSYIIVRQHELSWARGEMTAVLAIVAFGLVLYNGLVDRPGEPSGQIELEWGWYVALLGTALMIGGSALRSTESGQQRKPPGTL